MSKLEKLPIFFVSVETLINMYKQNENIKFENLGVITDQKIAICQVYYPEKRIVSTNPLVFDVNKEKLIKWRQKIVQFIVDDLVLRYQKGQSNATLTISAKEVFNFIDYVDKNNLELNDNIQIAQKVFWRYTSFLKSKIRDRGYSPRYAHSLHIRAYKLLSTIYQDKENIITSGIKTITPTKQKKTEKSQILDQKYHYNFYNSLFNQITDFLLENKPYPLKLHLPSGDIWCLPSNRTFFITDKEFPMAFNPKCGEVRGEQEIKDLFHWPLLSNARSIRKDFLKRLDTHNNYYSDKRFKLASSALKAFYILFLSNTGMNDSTAATLEWNKNYTLDKDRQKFTNIKYRAGNKPVEFQIQSKFLQDFKKYLLLRDYLLNGKEFNYLFFSEHDDKAHVSSAQKKGAFSSHINIDFTKHLDSNLPRLNSRQLRVNKTHQVIQSDGIIAASQLAQSSISTIMSAYLGESQESSENQFNEYFASLNKTIFEKSSSEKETVIGHCKNPNHPDQQFSPPIFYNDCGHKEGCLYCKQFGLHADKTDLQKLYSLKYVIHECRHIAKNEEHFTRVYGGVLNRLQSIEEEITNTNILTRDLLNEYEKDVFENENLHPYWEHKIDTLVSMGVLR